MTNCLAVRRWRAYPQRQTNPLVCGVFVVGDASQRQREPECGASTRRSRDAYVAAMLAHNLARNK